MKKIEYDGDFEKYKKRHILDIKELIKKGEDILGTVKSNLSTIKRIVEFKSAKSRSELTPQQIEDLSRKNKKWWAEALEKYEKLLSFETEAKTKHELTKRELEKWISAKNFCD